MTGELWAMCFPGERYDGGSSLQDLYDVAARRCPQALRAWLGRRLVVGDPVPAHLARYFAAPWRRVYTLNTDDLEVAVARGFEMGRRLEVVHLNGVVSADPGSVTFSTLQYGARLTAGDPLYQQMVRDLAEGPFVFVGTVLDEMPLWRHVHAEGAAPAHPASVLVSPELSRARAELLAQLGVTWLPMTAETFAREVLGPAGVAVPARR
jgi:hypothetical protein